MFHLGDFIKPNDEEYVYQITSFFHDSDGNIESYNGTSIAHGHGRSFSVNATHYREATKDEIKNELENAPKYYPFWVSNKRRVIISSGHIFAKSLEKAKEIFNDMLIHMNNVGEFYMSEKPTNFIQNFTTK